MDPEMVATPVMPSRAVIPVQKIVYGADHVLPSAEGKALYSVRIVAGKFAGVEYLKRTVASISETEFPNSVDRACFGSWFTEVSPACAVVIRIRHGDAMVGEVIRISGYRKPLRNAETMRLRGSWRTKGLSRSVALVTSVTIEPSGLP